MKKIAVVGSISSGKSTACRFFEDLGACVVNADAIVHQLLIPATLVGQKAIHLLGDSIVVEGGINREEVSKHVFQNPSLLEEIEELLHPEVQKVIETKYQEISQKAYPLFVAEVPLLFEGKLEKSYDVIVVIDADKRRRVQRFIEKTSYDEAEFERREARLMSIEEKCKYTDFVFKNNGQLSLLHHFIEKTFNRLKG